MEAPTPRFFETDNKPLAHLEWEAIRVICFEGSHMHIADAYPKFEHSHNFWIEHFNQQATKEHHAINSRIKRNEFDALDDFYDALQTILKPKPRGKMLKDLKRRNAQKEHQREVKGAAFIDNDPLLSAAAKSAFELAETNADDTAIAAKAAELAIEFDNGNPLSDVQMGVLCEFIQKHIDKHLKLDRIEAELIDDPDKNVYYMWGQIKRRCPKGANIAWSHSTAIQYGRCSKSQVTAVMNKLIKLGAVTRIQEGKRGQNSSRAAIYRREV